jgi:uncharacterized coiled-coil protein SlyX
MEIQDIIDSLNQQIANSQQIIDGANADIASYQATIDALSDPATLATQTNNLSGKIQLKT